MSIEMEILKLKQAVKDLKQENKELKTKLCEVGDVINDNADLMDEFVHWTEKSLSKLGLRIKR